MCIANYTIWASQRSLFIPSSKVRRVRHNWKICDGPAVLCWWEKGCSKVPDNPGIQLLEIVFNLSSSLNA